MPSDVQTFYTDHDPYVTEWIRRLVAAEALPHGHVVTCDIGEVAQWANRDTTVHLFAGIGGWALALHMAGWPADWPVWTASLPCQPFSTAGARSGTDDTRHLWPVVRRLIRIERPAIVLGEQVASPLGRAWLSTVRSDMEAMGYAFGAADLPAAGVAAPHIRQRLFWGASDYRMANGHLSWRRDQAAGSGAGPDGAWSLAETAAGGPGGAGGFPAWTAGWGVAHPPHEGREGERRTAAGREAPLPADAGGGVGLGDDDAPALEGSDGGAAGDPRGEVAAGLPGAGGGLPDGDGGGRGRRNGQHEPHGPSPIVLAACIDGKARPFERTILPVAHGVPVRMGRDGANEAYVRRGMIRGYGNAIVPQAGALFARAFMEATEEMR